MSSPGINSFACRARRLSLLLLIPLALAVAASVLCAGSYNVQRISKADFTPAKNGYICGHGNYVYVSKRDSFAIVDVSLPANPRIFGPYKVDTANASAEVGHGKAYVWPYGDHHIHLALPKNNGSGPVCVYVFDVDNPANPVLKGKIENVPRLFTERFYSAFVDTTPPADSTSPVWLFAASNTCTTQTICNDTVYVFNIRDILAAPIEDAPVVIHTPDFKWYPGCNAGKPPGPAGARGHDITVHGNRLIVTNPGGGLYVVDIGLLRGQPPSLPQELGRCEYPYAMTHDGWMSKNMDYVFTTDEHFLEWGCHGLSCWRRHNNDL